jgi:predicted PurR-regulated permease PerM
MALPIQQQAKYWGITIAVTAIVLWYLGDVLLPFVLGAAIAYFLDPVADRLEALGLSRIAATAVITIGAVIMFIVAAVIIIPTLVQQTTNLFNVAPVMFTKLQGVLAENVPSIMDENSAIRGALSSVGDTIKEKGASLLGAALQSAASLLNIVMLFVIVPVVAVYLLLDWDKMIARINDFLPRDHAPTLRALAKDIDTTLSSFVRGMGSVCLILGTYYAAALMLVGLDFGLIVGAIAGLITFIPYVGSLVGGALAIGLGLFQFWGDWVSLGLVAGIFIIGQVIEGNYLTPKLVGTSVGLHPVWLMLALSVFGAAFGFIGMLVAVPVAASIGVIVRFGSTQYLESRLYRGLSGQDTEEN